MTTPLREAHFCLTCEFRLPYCVRSDREFCGERCRGWWYLHPGQKRLDFARGDARTGRRKRGQPKTLAEALVALAELRVHAERLEADARKRITQQHKQRNNWSELSLSLTKVRAQSRRETDALKDEVESLKEQLAESEQRAKESGGTEKELRAQVAELKAELERAKQTEKELRTANEELAGQHKEELAEERQKLAAAEATIKELHEVADSLSGNLIEEQKLRAAAEERGDKLSQDIEEMLTGESVPLSTQKQASLFDAWDRHKSAELHDTRQHRDAALAQRERYARRILRMMSPGQYLDHAMAAGHDVTQDPLLHDKRVEILVEAELAEVQRTEKPNGRARGLDIEQTVDEQAYAAAMAFRWQHINRPHRERRGKTKWIVVGFKLDAESESYLRRLTRARIRRMERSLGR